MKDVKKPGTLFEFDGKLYETIGWTDGVTVIVQPVRERDYDRCECGRAFPYQQQNYVMSAPNLQDHIGAIYGPPTTKEKET